ncbi:hypothetical protein GCM10011376_12040 [Nocardioides flavus (ex Wang et al. 2016)]|uniref:Phospholipase_D-nuclease N-terminal n=1 Tax=Nocardioides flavus (ex Wang et al. 2016) TaxID=2058780 RepID=A0ABQ3HK88_9ACTN|nr:hypothetical protein [Nocardioides flavus (ex Wang et al. 2016)]GHE16594.1 hypothetical protein GCM10011376_12040 [Nocardioides flavus (ex Wang et al. 2016)]
MRTLEKRDVLPGADVAAPVTLALGVLFALAVAFAYVLSLADGVNPPDWVRVVGLVWLPLGMAGVPIGYYWSRGGAQRRLAEVGLALGVVGAVAFAALVIAVG